MITAVDAHACGEPGRVIVGGVLDVPGKTMFEKARYLQQHADHLRRRTARAARLSGPLLQPHIASHTAQLRRWIRNHGASGISSHVGIKHHLRCDRAD